MGSGVARPDNVEKQVTHPGRSQNSPSFRILQALSCMFVYTLVSCVSAVIGVDSISWEVPLE